MYITLSGLLSGSSLVTTALKIETLKMEIKFGRTGAPISTCLELT